VNSNREKLEKQSSRNKGSGYVQKPVEKSTNTLEKFFWHRKCRLIRKYMQYQKHKFLEKKMKEKLLENHRSYSNL